LPASLAGDRFFRKGRLTVAAHERRTPTPAELRAFALGHLDPQRHGEVEAHLAEHPECLEILEATPDDEVVQHLRGAGALPKARARPWLLELAVEAVIPVLGGCAGALAGGGGGGLVGFVAGQIAEKAINYFGQRIVDRWLEWFRKQPAGLQAAALSELAGMAPEVARGDVSAILAEQAPQTGPADRQVAIDYLSAIPRSVRRSLLSGRERRGAQLPPTISPADSLSLLQLLPTDLPPYPARTALPGTDYQLEELIGTGGFGAVYRASSPSLQYLSLAIKFCLNRSLLPALQQERANLERLMRAGGETWSPHLVRLYGYNLEHHTPFLVYEFVAGGDLVRWLASHQARAARRLTAAEALALITQVAEALAFAHERGLVHRDLKPANVLLTEDGTIKLADFGIGGLVARQAVQASRIGTVASNRLSPAEQASLFRGAGTPLYMSPEQKQGAAPDPRQDIYSLGVLWYQLLLGDVTREMAHGWARELEMKYAVPAGHIRLIDQCVGWIEERSKDAGSLLPMLRKLQGPAAAQTTTPATEPRPKSHVPTAAVPPPPARSSEGHSEKSPVPPTAASERSRQIRFVLGLRELVKRHQMHASMSGMFPALVILMGLGVPAGIFVGGMLSVRLGVQGWTGSGADSTELARAVIGGLLTCCTILSLGIWGHWTIRARAERDLVAKIDEMLTALPQECQTWGGQAALADREMVKEILRELDQNSRSE
jgi:serine/threonine protein kinase